MDILVLIAIAFGPFFGIWAHGKLEDRKRTYERKLGIFKTLMATRATPLSAQHVEALNRIDIEFTKRNEKKIRETWKVLLDHYGEGPKPPTKPTPGAPQAEQDRYAADWRIYEDADKRWAERGIDRRATLLKEMGVLFKYGFDEVEIKKHAYYPKLHGDIESEQRFLLVTANDVLSGKRPLAMYVTNWPDELNPEQKLMIKKLTESIGDDGAYKVRIVRDDETSPS
jgi:hypothetical protein